MTNIPMVALVGRPNVGKSTLFNRIVGQQLAVVHDVAGTTRDRQHAEALWNGVNFLLVDTGGIEATHRIAKGAQDPLAEDSAEFVEEIRDQAEAAIREADVIVFVVDIQTGIVAADQEVAKLLRRSDKPIIVAANKGDNMQIQQNVYEFYNLGMEQIFAISSQHGLNTGDLLDAIVEALPVEPEDQIEEEDGPVKVALLGRPNVGKSSLLNRLLGRERVIVSDVAGTTRDSIDTEITFEGEEIVLIDTAGIRKRGKIEPGVEKWSTLRSLKAIARADVCLLLIDATEGPTAQDAHIAGFILDEKKSAVVLVNKWDAIEKDAYTMIDYAYQVRSTLAFLPYVPVEFISAKTGKRVDQVLPLALEVYDERFARIPTSEVNRILRDAMAKQAPPSKAGRRLKIRYASQVAIDPPKFVFHVNDERLVHFSYQRFLENQIRDHYPFVGTPLQLSFRENVRDRGRKKR